MKFFLRALTSLMLLLVVCACGQKGRLVLPVRPPAISTPYPTAVPKADDAVPAVPEAGKK